VLSLEFTKSASTALDALKRDPSKAAAAKAVQRALAKLEQNPSHPGLHVKARKGETCPHGKTLYQAYAQNKAPGAYRIYFCYAPLRTLLIVTITSHE
jgi:hypothetical protein